MEQEYIVFKLVNEQYAHRVGVITEVMVYSEPVPVPGAPSEVEGVLNVRGNVITVISGRKLFEMEPTKQNNDEWRIILLETPYGPCGVSVDAVEEIVRFPEGDIVNSDRMAESELIKGTVQHALGLLILADFTEIGKKQEDHG